MACSIKLIVHAGFLRYAAFKSAKNKHTNKQ